MDFNGWGNTALRNAGTRGLKMEKRRELIKAVKGKNE